MAERSELVRAGDDDDREALIGKVTSEKGRLGARLDCNPPRWLKTPAPGPPLPSSAAADKLSGLATGRCRQLIRPLSAANRSAGWAMSSEDMEKFGP